jgi:hypothetical protein
MPQVFEAVEAVRLRALDVDVKYDNPGNLAGG